MSSDRRKEVRRIHLSLYTDYFSVMGEYTYIYIGKGNGVSSLNKRWEQASELVS